MGCAQSTNAASPVASVTSEDFFGRYHLGHKIGRGSYAQVYVASRTTKQKSGGVAVKIRNLRNSLSPSGLDKKTCRSAYKEVCLWSRVGKHSHCVHMYESFFDDQLCYMVMEKCGSGLIEHVESLDAITEVSLAKVFHHMLQGIAHIHSLNIVHRDIKPDNFVVGGTDSKTVKLGDFGLAAYVPPDGKVQGVCGTSPFMPPEMLLKREVDLKADVWSFGVLAFSFMCGYFPYGSKDCNGKAMKLAIADGRAPKCRKPWLTACANGFLRSVLQREPCSRLSATAALHSGFITSNLEAKSDSEVSLRGMLVSLGQTGLFDPPSLVRKSTIDALCDDIEKGRIQRNSKTLTQSQIDAFIGATPNEIDQFVESFWFPEGSVNACKDDESPKTSATTLYEHFPEDDSSNKTTASENHPDDDSTSKATVHDTNSDDSNVADAGSK